MKKITLLLIFSVQLFFVQAQIVNESVNFDSYVSVTDHDFVNHFNSGQGLYQVLTGGITGGCLVVPTTMNWGNDNAVYCSKYEADSGFYCKTTVAFKYDTAIFNSSGFDRAVSIFLHPHTDFNHYIIASVSHTQRIEVLTYSWTNSPGPVLNLVNNHWYELGLRAHFVGGGSSSQINVTSFVNDLGITGLDAPVLVNTSLGTFYDSVLFADTAIQVSFTATNNGGAKYIDNFYFEGIKSADSCISIPTGIPEKPETDFSVFVSGNELVIRNPARPDGQWVEIFSSTGSKIYSGSLLRDETVIRIPGIAPGIYFVRVKAFSDSFTKKIAITR